MKFLSPNMELITIQCTQCASTDFNQIKGGLVKCNYCGSSFMLPNNIHTHKWLYCAITGKWKCACGLIGSTKNKKT